MTESVRAEERLREARERYRTLVEQIPAVLYIIPSDGSNITLYVSPQIEALLGYTPEEWMATNLWVEQIHPDDVSWVLVAKDRSRERGEPFAEEYCRLARDGSVVWVREEMVHVRDEGDAPLFVQGIITDITGRRLAEMALRESEQRFRESFENGATGMALVGTDGRFLRVNRSLCEIVGYSQRELLGKSYRDITHPDDLEIDLEYHQQLLTGEIRTYQIEKRYLHKEGHVVWALLGASLVRDEEDKPFYFISQIQDLSERKRMEEQLQHQALHDALTGLPNRKLFMDRLRHALKYTRRTKDRKVAVLFIDLDGFKIINDSLGHRAGDLLLGLVTERLRPSLRPEDTLARFAGDEFVVLIEDVENLSDVIKVARRVTEEFRRPFVLEGKGVFVSASIGIALGDVCAESPAEDLVRGADTAMYWAKKEHTNYRVFDPTMYEQAIERLKTENDLRRAIERDEFVIHYQPVVRLDIMRIVGFEALVRWEHPERGLVMPDDFIPVAEELGVIVPLGRWALREACRQAKEWQKRYQSFTDLPLFVSVNLSVRQLDHPDLVGDVERILQETGLDPGRLTLEITESVRIKYEELHGDILWRLRELGVRFALDDFGTGYSSLSYLKRLPIGLLKIDGSFVAELGVGTEDKVILSGLIDIAHGLGCFVAAEGLETSEQLAQVKSLGCDLAQGHYFSEPLTAEVAMVLLAKGHAQ